MESEIRVRFPFNQQHTGYGVMACISPCHGEGRGSNPLVGAHALIAQLDESAALRTLRLGVRISLRVLILKLPNYEMKRLLLIIALLPLMSKAQLVQPGLILSVHSDASGSTKEIQVIYRDPGRCTDVSFIELITDSGHVALKPIKHQMSCQIVSWGRIISTDDYRLLRARPLKAIRIENPESENVYYYQVTDENYLRRVLRD
jgi:hypothetical protein